MLRCSILPQRVPPPSGEPSNTMIASLACQAPFSSPSRHRLRCLQQHTSRGLRAAVPAPRLPFGEAPRRSSRRPGDVPLDLLRPPDGGPGSTGDSAAAAVARRGPSALGSTLGAAPFHARDRYPTIPHTACQARLAPYDLRLAPGSPRLRGALRTRWMAGRLTSERLTDPVRLRWQHPTGAATLPPR